jgi:acetyl-CoA decarbonylase/synthase complex subunit delta
MSHYLRTRGLFDDEVSYMNTKTIHPDTATLSYSHRIQLPRLFIYRCRYYKGGNFEFRILQRILCRAIKAISIGDGDKAVTVGGETCYPFYQFEGDMPHKPKLPWKSGTWHPKSGRKRPGTLQGCGSDPAAWAKKCVDDYGAEMIVLQLKSIDPNGEDASAGDASATVKKVLDAIDVPLMSGDAANHEKDEAVLKQIAEDCQDART